MSMNTELLQFMDGTLAPEQEAELLHRLSVSPERREILRSFFNMKVVMERDRNSIAVPYAAEQKLWASLGQMMPPMVQNAAAPAAAALETAAVTAARTGFFRSAFSMASVAALCLLIGLGSGYFAGKNSAQENTIAQSPLGLAAGQPSASVPDAGNFSAAATSPVGRLPQQVSPSAKLFAERTKSPFHYFNAAQHSIIPSTEAPLDNEMQNVGGHNDVTENLNAPVAVAPVNPAMPQISSVAPKQIAEANVNTQYMRDPSQFSLRSPFEMGEITNIPQKSFIQKFEFYFNEGIGKQFPNNAATNVSMPVVTNSSISALFQPFANTPGVLSHFWGGGSFGTANVTQKKLRLDLDPVTKNYVMISEPVHVQTTWGGGMLQFRIPVSRKLALTATGTIGNSSVGAILGGEIGMHADVTSDVGIVLGFRGTHISYNIDQQQQDLINQAKTLGLGIPTSALGNQLSYNFEISSGIYFHF